MVFLLNALVLCLSVTNELFDIQYCRAIAESYPDAPLVKNICIWVVEAFRQYLFLPLTLAMPIGMVYTLGGSALQTTLNTLAVVFLLEIDDLLYNAVIDARYKRYARRHRFRLRWFDYYLLDAKRFVVIVTCMTAMVLLVNNHAREFGRDSILTFVWIMVAIGFLDTLADPEEGRRVLTSCGVKMTRLRSTLTALLVWFVLVSLVRTLAITVFEVVTDFNAERGNPENGKV